MEELYKVITVVNTRNNTGIMVSLQGDWKGYQKIYCKLYPIKFTDIAYLLELNLNIFGVIGAMSRGFITTPENENFVPKKIPPY